MEKKTIVAKTFEQSVEIERELINQGFHFLKTEGKRVMYYRNTLRDICRADIYMAFWGSNC